MRYSYIGRHKCAEDGSEEVANIEYFGSGVNYGTYPNVDPLKSQLMYSNSATEMWACDRIGNSQIPARASWSRLPHTQLPLTGLIVLIFIITAALFPSFTTPGTSRGLQRLIDP